MRIGIVCYPSIGGSGLVATELAASLAHMGNEIHVISYAAPFKLRRFERNISFHTVDPINYPLFNQSLYTFALTAKIIEVVEEYKLDVVHAHYSIPHSLCAHLAKEVSDRDFRIVTTLHGTDVTIVGQDRPLYPINRYGIEQSDVVTTVSKFQRDYTLNCFKIDKDIQVIHNFIDPDTFRPDGADKSTRDCLADSDEKIVMHISNFREPKNVAGVVKAFAHAAEKSRSRLVLVGDGPGVGEIKHLCRDLEICNRVTNIGKVDNVETILPHADCVLQPSYHESFGMVLLEAMSCCVPTISSNIDGIPEVVVQGETGFMAGPDDHEALGDFVAEVCNDDGLAARLGKAGRERAIDCFHRDKIVPKYLCCYESCCCGDC